MSYILAIDQSTSATKASLFDDRGRAVDTESLPHRQLYPQAGWVEHDAEEIWQNFLSVLRAIVERNHIKMSAATALAITNQRETFVVFERQTGRPLHNAIVWQCRRGALLCNRLERDGIGEVVRAKTGLKLDTYFSGPKLKWLIGQSSEIRRQLENGDALIGTMDSYLIYRLTAGNVFATDSTNASRTLLFDIHRARWDEELCTLFDVPMRALPEIRESFASFGMTDGEGLLSATLPICGVMGDSQASLFGQCCYERGATKATFGSGTSLLMNTGGTLPVPSQGSVAALGWVWQGRPTYAIEGIINYSSATIAWLKDQLGLIDDVSQTGVLANSIADNGGVYLVPAFAGLSAPYWKPNARAAIVGMTAHARKEHIVRAALESIAYQIRDCLEVMRREADVDPQLIFADGGPTRNEFLMQFTADISGVELRAADAAESSARGAVLAALLGMGEVNSFSDLAAMPRNVRSYHPRMPRNVVEQLYSGWKSAVKRVL